MKKRLFSMFLALVMVLGLLPATALAAGDVAKFNGTGYASVQDAVDAAAAAGGTVEVEIIADTNEEVTIPEAADLHLTLKGSDANTFSGKILLKGNSSYENGSTTIQGITFDAKNLSGAAGDDACIYVPWTSGAGSQYNLYRYTQNVTVSGCTFKDSGNDRNAVAMKQATGGCKNWTVIDCTVESSMHSLLQLHGVDGVVVENSTVESKNGINLGSSDNIEVKGSSFDVSGYCIRTGDTSGGLADPETISVSDTSLKTSATDEGAIVLRGSADNAEITLSGITVDAAIAIDATKTADKGDSATFTGDVIDNGDGTYGFTNPKTFTIVYRNWYDGTNQGTYTQTVSTGRGVTLTANKHQRYGYEFDHWNSKRDTDDGAFNFTDGQTLTAEEVNALYEYAKKNDGKAYLNTYWKGRTFTITYRSWYDGTNHGTYTQTATYGEELTLTANKHQRYGYEFDHWNSKRDTDDGAFNFTDAQTLTAEEVNALYEYAKDNGTAWLNTYWKGRTFTVTFRNWYGNTNHGTYTQTATYGEELELKANTFKRTGYTFDHWNSKRDTNDGAFNFADQAVVTVEDVNAMYDYAKEHGTAWLNTYWTPKTYTVTFDANGGVVDLASVSVTYDSAYGTLPVPTKTGYEFTGWTDKSGAVVSAETVYKIAGDSTLKAVYNAKTYTVTLNPDGGSVTPEKVTVIYDEKVGTLPTPEREGYKFLGWFDAEGNEVTAETDYTTDGDTELKAQWEKVIFNVIVADTENGTVEASTNQASVGDTVTVTATPKDGYKLDALKYSYYRSDWGGTHSKPITNGTFTMPAADVTISAEFAPNEYTVTFDANGGTVDPVTKTVTFDSEYGTLPVPTKKGHDFVGWFLDDTKIDATSVVAVADNHTLTAQWKKTVYTITVEATEGGTVEVAETATMKDYVALTITPNKGWKVVKAELKYFVDTSYTTQLLKADGSTAKGFMMPAANVTVVVEFEKIEYTITVEDTENGSITVTVNGVETDKATIDDEVVVTVTPDEHYKVGQAKWSYTGKSTIRYGSFKFTMPADDVTVSARFDPIIYSITVNQPEHGYIKVTLDGEEVTSAQSGKTIKVEYTADEGYEVVYRRKTIGNSTELMNGDFTLTMSADVTFSATVAPKEYTVTLNPDGGKVDPTKITVTYDAAYGELPKPERTGYTFDGWFLGNTQIKATDKVAVAADHELVAHWTVNTYWLTFETKVDTIPAPNKKEVTFGEVVGDLPDPERTGYTFNGWFDNKGIQIKEDTVVDFTEDKLLTAKWTANKYTVTFDVNGGDALAEEDQSKTVTFDSEYGTLPVPTRTGYTFLYWTLNGDKIEATDKVATADNHELVAQWKINKYTVTYMIEGMWFKGEFATKEVEYGAAVEAIDAAKEGYEFSGWTGIPATMPANPITVTGSYKRDIANATLSAIADVTYTGSAHTPKLTVSFDNGTYVLVEGVDYELAYENNVNAGTAKVTITAKGDNYCGETGTTFVINPKSIEGAAVEIEYVEVVYDGTEKEPKVVSVTLTDGTVLAETDYVVSYANNVSGDKGVATVIVEGIGNYKDTASTTFEFLYTVTFVTEGVTTPAKQYVKYGQTATNPGASVKFGSDFAGWYTEGRTKYDFNTPVTKPITLTAQFVFGPIGGLIVPPANNASVTVNGLNTVDHMAYIIGSGDGKVNPLGTITRAEVATIFFRLMNDDFRAKYWDNESSYADVAADAWYNVAVATLENAGIIKDTVTGGNFRPTDLITRAELAVMAAQFAVVSGEVPATTFVDVPATYWAAAEIAVVQYAGWIEGNNGMYRPDANLTRAECMTIVNRMLQRGAEAENMLADMTTFTDNAAGTWYYEAVQEATNSHTYNRTEAVLTGESFLGEKWVKMEAAPDWAALEKAWAEA